MLASSTDRRAARRDERARDRHRRRRQPAQLIERRDGGPEVAQRDAEAEIVERDDDAATRRRGRARPPPPECRASTTRPGRRGVRASMSRTSSGSSGDSAPARVSTTLEPGNDRARGAPLPLRELGEQRAHERDVERARHARFFDDLRDRVVRSCEARASPSRPRSRSRRPRRRRDSRSACTTTGSRGCVEQPADAARDAPALRELAAQLVVEHLDPAAPEPLGAVRGDVGVRQQLVDRHRVFALRGRDADARADEHFVTVHVVRLG